MILLYVEDYNVEWGDAVEREPSEKVKKQDCVRNWHVVLKSSHAVHDVNQLVRNFALENQKSWLGP